MIAAISLMRRRSDISIEQFRRHWLDPHGVMTAGLPGVRHYVQHHPIEATGTNALARELAIDGIPELWFDSYEHRRIAYTSPRIAECNIDSEAFVGAVTRLVTEPLTVAQASTQERPIRVLLLAVGTADADWAARVAERMSGRAGVIGYVQHKLLEQAAAPSSRIPELKLAIAGVAEVAFASEAALASSGAQLAGDGADVARTAIYRVEDYRLV